MRDAKGRKLESLEGREGAEKYSTERRDREGQEENEGAVVGGPQRVVVVARCGGVVDRERGVELDEGPSSDEKRRAGPREDGGDDSGDEASCRTSVFRRRSSDDGGERGVEQQRGRGRRGKAVVGDDGRGRGAEWYVIWRRGCGSAWRARPLGPRDTDSGRGRQAAAGPEGRMRDGVCHAMQCMMKTRTKSGVMGEIREWEQECEWERG